MSDVGRNANEPSGDPFWSFAVFPSTVGRARHCSLFFTSHDAHAHHTRQHDVDELRRTWLDTHGFDVLDSLESEIASEDDSRVEREEHFGERMEGQHGGYALWRRPGAPRRLRYALWR